jgi:hypothetical protein
VIELPEYIWSDIEEVLREDVLPFLTASRPSAVGRGDMHRGVEHIVRMVDAIRERQRVESSGQGSEAVQPSADKETTR